MRDEVDTGERSLLPILASEHHHSASLDLSHRVISEPHRAAKRLVQLRERVPGPRHVVGGPGITDPRAYITVLLLPELRGYFFLPEMHQVHTSDKITSLDRRLRPGNSASDTVSLNYVW
jgi:hypothetical protein